MTFEGSVPSVGGTVQEAEEVDANGPTHDQSLSTWSGARELTVLFLSQQQGYCRVDT